MIPTEIASIQTALPVPRQHPESSRKLSFSRNTCYYLYIEGSKTQPETHSPGATVEVKARDSSKTLKSNSQVCLANTASQPKSANKQPTPPVLITPSLCSANISQINVLSNVYHLITKSVLELAVLRMPQLKIGSLNQHFTSSYRTFTATIISGQVSQKHERRMREVSLSMTLIYQFLLQSAHYKALILQLCREEMPSLRPQFSWLESTIFILSFQVSCCHIQSALYQPSMMVYTQPCLQQSSGSNRD